MRTTCMIDEKTQSGDEAEAYAILHFVRKGWHVFTQLSGKAPCDLVVYDGTKLYRVQCKSASRRRSDASGYEVDLRSMRHNTSRVVCKKFDASHCDLLFVYIRPEQRCVVQDAKSFHGRSSVNVW